MNRKQFPATARAVAFAAKTAPHYPEQLFDIYPVPPLARRNDAKRSLNFPENEKLSRYLTEGGVRRIVYGGNAFLYQITMAEYTVSATSPPPHIVQGRQVHDQGGRLNSPVAPESRFRPAKHFPIDHR